MVINPKLKAAFFAKASREVVDFLLALNTHNRKPRQPLIAEYRAEIEAGRWEATNQGIGVSESGVLIDGQNRLMAIKAAGYPPVEILVVTGLSDTAQAKVDKGGKRTQADVIKLLLNREMSRDMVSAANVMIQAVPGDRSFSIRPGRVPEFELAGFIDGHGETMGRVIKAAGKMRAGVLAALCDYGIKGVADRAESFAASVKTGAGLSVDSPAFRLREVMSKRSGGGAAVQAEDYSLAAAACVADAFGARMRRLVMRGNWDMPS